MMFYSEYDPAGQIQVADDERGLALIATILVLGVLGILTVAALSGGIASLRTAASDYEEMRAFYMAEGGAEAALSDVKLALQDGYIDDGELAAIQPPDVEGFDFTEFRVERLGDARVETITDGPFAGMYSLTQRVRVTSGVTDRTGSHASVVLGVKAQAIPIFQFAFFNEGAIEDYSGRYSENRGRVHANGRIYMAAMKKHYVDAVVTTPNEFVMDGRVSHRDEHRINIWFHDDAGRQLKLRFDSFSEDDPETFRSRSIAEVDGRLRTKAFGVDSLKLPLPDDVSPRELITPLDPVNDGKVEKATKFAWQADTYVTVDLGHIQPIENVCGGTRPPGQDAIIPTITVIRPLGGGPPGDAQKCEIFEWSWEAFYDYEPEEDKWVDVIDVDMADLGDWARHATHPVSVVYVQIKPRDDVVLPSATSPSGDGYYFPVLRIKNGAELHGPLTIGSEYPYYVWGDYNTIDKKPAAIFGDRTGVLSNSWSDHHSPTRGARKPRASRTTQYFALIHGLGEGYIGCDHEKSHPDPGCTDIPPGKGPAGTIKLQENWNGVQHTLTGSLIALWAPQIASRYGSCCYHYDPPNRDWSFDTDLQNPANLPPATPNVGYVWRASFRPGH